MGGFSMLPKGAQNAPKPLFGVPGGPPGSPLAAPKNIQKLPRTNPVASQHWKERAGTGETRKTVSTVLSTNHIHTKDGEVIRPFFCTSRRDGII